MGLCSSASNIEPPEVPTDEVQRIVTAQGQKVPAEVKKVEQQLREEMKKNKKVEVKEAQMELQDGVSTDREIQKAATMRVLETTVRPSMKDSVWKELKPTLRKQLAPAAEDLPAAVRDRAIETACSRVRPQVDKQVDGMVDQLEENLLANLQAPNVPRSPSAMNGFIVIVDILSARNVKKMDFFSESDPYVKVHVGDEKAAQTTKVVNNNKYPVWNQSFKFPPAAQDVFDSNERPKQVCFNVYDKDSVSKDDFIGTATLNLSPLWDEEKSWKFQYLPIKPQKPKDELDNHGEIHVRVSCKTVDPRVRKEVEHYHFTHLVEAHVVDGSNLGGPNTKGSDIDSHVQVQWGTKTFTTRRVLNTREPRWDQSVFFWMNADTQANYQVVVSAFDKGDTDPLGVGYVPITDALQRSAEGDAGLVPYQLELSSKAVTDRDLGRVSNSNTAASPSATAEKGRGTLRLELRVIPKEQMFTDFFAKLVAEFDTSRGGTLDRDEVKTMLAALNVTLDDEGFETLFNTADQDANGAITPDEATTFLRALMFVNPAAANGVAQFVTGGHDAISRSLVAGVTETPSGKTINVIDRSSGLQVQENIPGYIQVALRSMFSSKTGRYLSTSSKAIALMKKLSVRQGKKYDDPASVKDIPAFIELHQLNLDEVERPLDEYKTFNEFFYRALKPSSRPIIAPDDDTIAAVPADCRLNVFTDVSAATRLWIKGDEFTVEGVLGPEAKRLAPRMSQGSIAICRLAPQDYHRWHTPVSGRLGRDNGVIDGALFTVNPLAINENVNVFTSNKRQILEIDSNEFGKVVMVAVGATMVGSITIYGKAGDVVKKGEQHGQFSFGGSTVIIFFEKDRIRFEEDLVVNSERSMETLVKVGQQLGVATNPQLGYDWEE